MSSPSIARSTSPMPLRELPPQARSVLTQLGRRIAQACGLLGPDDQLCVLELPEQRRFQHVALFAVSIVENPDVCEAEVLVHLRRSLAHKIHGCAFDQLHLDDRYDIADLALVAWRSMRDTLNGKAATLPKWERDCLTFSGPYDPELLTGANTGTVQ